MTIFRHGPRNRDVECRGYEKVAIFDQYVTISEMIQYTAIISMSAGTYSIGPLSRTGLFKFYSADTFVNT